MSDSGPDEPPRSEPSAYEAFRHRDFRIYVAMRTLFLMGQQMQTVAVGWQLYDLTRRPIDLGFAGLVLFLPKFFSPCPPDRPPTASTGASSSSRPRPSR